MLPRHPAKDNTKLRAALLGTLLPKYHIPVTLLTVLCPLTPDLCGLSLFLQSSLVSAGAAHRDGGHSSWSRRKGSPIFKFRVDLLDLYAEERKVLHSSMPFDLKALHKRRSTSAESNAVSETDRGTKIRQHGVQEIWNHNNSNSPRVNAGPKRAIDIKYAPTDPCWLGCCSRPKTF